MRLVGKRALITGGASGLGGAMSDVFIREGAKVFVLDRDEGALKKKLGELRKAGEAEGCSGSVASKHDVTRAFEEMDAAFGGIDSLINNAGVSANHPTLAVSPDDWERAIAVNLTGPFLCAQAAGQRMVEQGGGTIIGVSSIFGLVAAPERLAYCVSKAGIAMMAKALAIEWAQHGVRSNAIAPGYVHTRLIDELVERGRIDIPSLAARTPLGRFARPEEVAEMAVYLASDASEYVTGQVIAVDGGWTAYGYL